MTGFAQKLPALLSSRTAKNVYFWLYLAWTRTGYIYTPLKGGITLLLFVLLAVLFYTNNLVLIPSFYVRREFVKYCLWYTLLVAAIALVYILVLKTMLLYQPDFYPGAVSPLVMGGETAQFALHNVLSEWSNYFIGLFLSGGVFAMSWFVMDYQRQQRLVEQTKNEHLELQLTFLKNQINPHFLFNSLNNLYVLTQKKSDTAPDIVSKISVILRYLLYESGTRLVTFEKEREIMKAYIDLELLRLPGTTNMFFTISADSNYMIPPLLWLPVLENVFKHGARGIVAGQDIIYKFTIENNVLHIFSSNSVKQEQKENSVPSGIGLANFSQRLFLLFGNGYDLVQTSDSGKYITDITINIQNYERAYNR